MPLPIVRGLTLAAFVCVCAFAAESPSDPLTALDPIAARSAEIDLGTTALIIAHALNSAIDVSAYATRLDALASEMWPAVAAAPDARAKLEMMADFLYKRWGFADGKTLPAEVFVSFADVLDKRQWNCFGMSVLYVALGERVGLPLEMVSGRGHALVHCADTPYYIETTARGGVHEGIDYLADYLPFPCLDPREYQSVSVREAVAVLLTQTGAALAAQGKLDFALSCYRHALVFDRDHAEAHAALGFLYAQIRRIEDAIGALRSAIKADPKLREAYGGLGAALHAKGDLAGAVRALRNAVELCGEQPEAVFNLGQVLYEGGDLNGAIDVFRKYTALVPRDPDGFARLAFPLEDSGKLDEALAAYRESLRLNPGHADALVNSGAILEKQGKWDAAGERYSMCLKSSPGNALAYGGLGRVFTAKDQFDDAAKAYSRSLELDNGNPATWIDFAKLERKRGNITGAIEKLERALVINPAEPETHIELALAYHERGESSKAAEHARAASELGAILPGTLKSLFPSPDSQ